MEPSTPGVSHCFPEEKQTTVFNNGKWMKVNANIKATNTEPSFVGQGEVYYKELSRPIPSNHS